MRVFYEGGNYVAGQAQVVGGISRYFQHLIAGLDPGDTPIVSLPQRTTAFMPKHPNLRIVHLDYSQFRPWRLWQVYARQYGRYHRRFIQRDLDHPTNYIGTDGKPVRRGKAPLVVTVYDMIHERYPDDIDPTGRWRQVKREVITAADAVLCISRSTESDLLERIPEVKGRTRVTLLAADKPLPESDVTLPPELQGPDAVPFFLMVGQHIGKYKNFAGLVRAADLLLQEPDCPPFKVVVAGPALAPSELEMVQNLQRANCLMVFDHPKDPTLAKLYRNARALVYPSFFEGFGLPPLEAMQYGTPVIASTGGSIPEVVGNAGMLFDPHSPEELAQHMLLALRDPQGLSAYVELGYARARTFSWETTAAQTREVYKTLLKR